MGLVDDIPVAAAWVAGNLNATGYVVDGSVASLKEVDRFITEEHRQGGILDGAMGTVLFGLGCYVGQVIITAYGGRWVTDDASRSGEADVAVILADGSVVWPVRRVIDRVQQGLDSAIHPYVVLLAPRDGVR